MLYKMNTFSLVWLKICLTGHVAIISLAYECLMVVAFVLGFVLGFVSQVMIQLNVA